MSETREKTLIINHPSGLHLRPAALFVRTASRFKCQIFVQNMDRVGRPEVDAKSMFGIMQLGVSEGHRVHVRAVGEDAAEALATLEHLVETRFEEQS